MNSGKIGVIMNYDGDVNSLMNADEICIFMKQGTDWKHSKSHYVNLRNINELSFLRFEIRKIILSMEDCRIIAGDQISGIVYNEFDKQGFSIFEISKFSPQILDGIIEDVKAADVARMNKEDVKMTQPYESSIPGVYYFDLIQLQREFPEISSKKALQDFLENQPFYELNLVCEHIPPWLKAGFFDITDDKTDNGKTTVVIRKKQCGGE